MKKILFLAICCLGLVGCEKNEEATLYVTNCSNSAEQMLQTSTRLNSTIKHDKTNFISYTDNNLYMFSTLDEAITAEESLNNDCLNFKSQYVDCKIERDDKSVSLTINVECNDSLDCSYEKLIQEYESQGMKCEEDSNE